MKPKRPPTAPARTVQIRLSPRATAALDELRDHLINRHEAHANDDAASIEFRAEARYRADHFAAVSLAALCELAICQQVNAMSTVAAE